jgi:hypothetical protein
MDPASAACLQFLLIYANNPTRNLRGGLMRIKLNGELSLPSLASDLTLRLISINGQDVVAGSVGTSQLLVAPARRNSRLNGEHPGPDLASTPVLAGQRACQFAGIVVIVV